jgi:hypothetical protein
MCRELGTVPRAGCRLKAVAPGGESGLKWLVGGSGQTKDMSLEEIREIARREHAGQVDRAGATTSTRT